MLEIYTQESYQIKASKEIKKELNEKIKRKVSFLLWYIADEAKKDSLNLEISAGILGTGRVALFFTDENTGAMFDSCAFPLALWIYPVFKYNENFEVTGIISIDIEPADVDSWTDYFKKLRSVKAAFSFLPKARGVR